MRNTVHWGSFAGGGGTVDLLYSVTSSFVQSPFIPGGDRGGGVVHETFPHWTATLKPHLTDTTVTPDTFSTKADATPF